MHNIEVVSRIVSVDERKRVETIFGSAEVAAAILRDETRSIKLNYWRRQIDTVREGDLVMLVNAFASSFGGVVELNIGGDNRIIVLEGRGGSNARK